MRGIDIKIARIRSGIRQQKLADIIEVTQSWMSQIECEHKKPSEKLLRKIVATLEQESAGYIRAKEEE